MHILTERPSIDEHDFSTIRQLYGEAQQWARHYEAMVVNANVLVVSASLIILGLAFDIDVPFKQGVIILIVPLVMSGIGIFLTKMLFNLYCDCISRMIRFENLLNCYDIKRYEKIDSQGSLLPQELSVISKPESVKFFERLYILLSFVYIVLIAIKVNPFQYLN